MRWEVVKQYEGRMRLCDRWAEEPNGFNREWNETLDLVSQDGEVVLISQESSGRYSSHTSYVISKEKLIEIFKNQGKKV